LFSKSEGNVNKIAICNKIEILSLRVNCGAKVTVGVKQNCGVQQQELGLDIHLMFDKGISKLRKLLVQLRNAFDATWHSESSLTPMIEIQKQRHLVRLKSTSHLN
jgi:hypothetical protein